MNKCDVLSLELYSTGRDIDIVEPVLIYLEYKYSLKVVRCSGDNYGYYLLKYQPKLLLISNSVGSDYKTSAVKLASLLGIRVVSLVSEGQDNCEGFDNDEDLSNFYWGTNKEKKLYEDLNLVWNNNLYNLASNILSKHELKKINVSGATGMDKYFIFRNRYDRNTFFNRKGLRIYNKIILITSWSFSLLYGEYFHRNQEVICGFLGGKDYVKLHRNNGVEVRKIYENIIKENQDILFLVKIHPAEMDCDEGDNTRSEYYGLDNYSNVKFIYPYTDSMLELISISDILISYESTTAMEAWLMGKNVVFVNPGEDDFPRNDFYKGVAVAKSKNDIAAYLKEFYSNGSIRDFAEKEKERSKIEVDVMQYADGKNHIRAANKVMSVLKITKKKKKINLWVCLEILKAVIKKIIGYNTMRLKYNYEERKVCSDNYRMALLKFYNENGDTVKNIN